MRPYPKDWERKVQVSLKLFEKQMSSADLARTLGVQRSHVSEVIWGIRRSPVMEERIAQFFSMTREELFPKKRRRKDEGGQAA